MLHPFAVLVWGMGASLVVFIAAYLQRRRNNRQHRMLALLGVALNILSSIYLVYAVRVAGITMVARYNETIIVAHRLFAAAVVVLMLAMAYTGMRRMRSIHIALHRYFLASYAISYFSGLVIFYP